MSPLEWSITTMTRDEVAERRQRYDPLVDSIRQLVDAALRTEADDGAVLLARAEIDAATARLREHQGATTCGVSLTPEGESIGWGNVADGLRNPLAPPLVIQTDASGQAYIDVELGAAYEGAPGHLHGGYGALVLDHLLGHVASNGSAETVAATGTISLRYQRPTRLGRLRVEAEIGRTDGRKIYVTGHIADADGITITAEGLFIVLRQ